LVSIHAWGACDGSPNLPEPTLFNEKHIIIMKKGTSNAIMTVLVLMITTFLVLLLYSWLSGYTPQTQSEIEKNIDREEGCLRIESINTVSKNISVRNCGNIDLNNIAFFVDSNLVASYGTLRQGSVMQINYNMPSGEHEIFVTSDYAETSRMSVLIP
jgi:hypothetical protein